ncbi:MAG: tRNA preQ1(34) S-adenosylmethionine ribosyltransferase-isomerase QueA [Nevskiales bacterium]
MLRSDFHYDLPAELIAQHPLPVRSASRLLCLDGASGALTDRQMQDFPQLLRSGDLLVFNDTRVIPARLHGAKSSGGRVEVLVERVLDERRVLAQIRASKPPGAGVRLQLADGAVAAEVQGREGEFYILTLYGAGAALELLQAHGQIPLPPYIERALERADEERYQTVFAKREGAVAAPTAGLHFDEHLLAECRMRGVEFGYVTLHVGAGTFQPMRVDRLEDHVMHAERLEVEDVLCRQVENARERGGRVIAVGTTAVRALETSALQKASPSPLAGEGWGEGEKRNPAVSPYSGETRLFIYPGFRYRVVDALLTNFHLPESTLLMLVSAFGGQEFVQRAYRHAVQQRYRFFSYGDAMWLTPAAGVRA